MGRWRLRHQRHRSHRTKRRGRQGRRPRHRLRFARQEIANGWKGRTFMADLRSNFIGIKSPNPFWLASAPPTDKEYNVVRAFKAGWGGVVWKTLGEDPPIVNTASRYGALHYADDKMIGFN